MRRSKLESEEKDQGRSDGAAAEKERDRFVRVGMTAIRGISSSPGRSSEAQTATARDRGVRSQSHARLCP